MYVILGLLHAIIIQRPYDQKKGGGAEETKKERESGGGGCNQRPTEGREGMRLSSKGIEIREVGERNLWVERVRERDTVRERERRRREGVGGRELLRGKRRIDI